MSQDTGLTFALQEALLVILAFDTKYAHFVRNAVPYTLFEGDYQLIAKHIYEYLDKQGEPPGEYQLDGIFDYILEGDDKRKSDRFARVLVNMYEAREGVNAEYAISRLSEWVRQQELKKGIVEAANLIQEGRLDAAESRLAQATKQRLRIFDPGTRLSDIDRAFSFFDKRERGTFPTGVPELDEHHLGPTRKGLHLFIALANRGKSWWLINLGKYALLRSALLHALYNEDTQDRKRLKVLHISLEMSEESVTERYFQALTGSSTRQKARDHSEFERDPTLGTIIGLKPPVSPTPKIALHKEGAKAKLHKTVSAEIYKRIMSNIIIKEFPSGSLSISQLNAYLDNLEIMLNGWQPDLLILDYADLMKLDRDNLRIDLGQTYVELRGTAVERNIAIATATQANRLALLRGKVTEANVSEDFSKVHTVDTAIAYNQSEAEADIGVAQLRVVKARTETARVHVVVSQNYSIGQFCVDSGPFTDGYKNTISGP